MAIDWDSADFVAPIKSHSILDSSNVSTNPFPDFLGQHNQTDYLLQGINEIDHEWKYDDFEGTNHAPIGVSSKEFTPNRGEGVKEKVDDSSLTNNSSRNLLGIKEQGHNTFTTIQVPNCYWQLLIDKKVISIVDSN